MQTFFHIANASKAYSGVPALQNASLTLRHGEVHALIGENGAGKSTLIKIMAGVVSPDSAAFTLRGESVSIQSPQDALALGLRFIHQELSFVPELSVAENIFLGQVYPRIGGVLVNWRELNRQAREVLHSVGIDHIQPQVQMARLSTGDQMLVRIAAAFVDSTALDDDGERTAKVYVMDEPTAALTGAEVEMLFGVIRELKAIGDAVLYVSHRLDEIFTIADTVTVMRNGEVVTTQPVSEMTHDDMIVQMTGRELVNVYPPRETMLKDTPTLVVNNLMTPSLHGVSFTLVEGEILGVTGLRASGQTELLRALIGTDRITSGNITLNGSNIPGTTTHRWQEGITYVPRERRSEGLMMGRSVRDNMVLPHLRDLAVGGVFTDYRQERQFSSQYADDVRLKSTGPEQIVRELSGGNQQKVVFARALANRPRLLLLDEPTRGVDVGAKFDIYSLIRDISANGTAIVMSSTDLPELIGMCDRIMVMNNGSPVTVVESAGLTEGDLLRLCYEEAVQ